MLNSVEVETVYLNSNFHMNVWSVKHSHIFYLDFARSLCSVVCPSAQGNLIYAILKLIYLLVVFDAKYSIARVCASSNEGI